MIQVLLFIFLAGSVALFAPVAVIWSLNELFELSIAYTPFTLLAAFVLLLLFSPAYKK